MSRPICCVLLCLLPLSGCFPLLRSEGPPDEIEESVLTLFEPDEKLLVLPIWERTPFWKTDTSGGDSAFVEEVLFLSAAALPELPSMIEGKTTAMVIIGAGAAMGRGVEFQGFFIISSQGQLAWLNSYGTSYWHETPEVATLSPTWHQELLAVLPELDDFTRDRSPLWSNMPRAEIELDIDSDSRTRAHQFLTSTTISSNTTDSWHPLPRATKHTADAKQ